MQLIDKKEYQRLLKELMETPFGYQQKPSVTQPESTPKVINEQPIETQTTPVYTTPPQIHIIKEQQPVVIRQEPPVIVKEQPPPSFSFKKQFNMTGLGVGIALTGLFGGYMYLTNPAIKTMVVNTLGKLTVFSNHPLLIGIIGFGCIIAIAGLFRRQ